jgi:hypothetical protein
MQSRMKLKGVIHGFRWSFTVLVLETTQNLRNEKGVDLKGEENGGSTTVIMHSRECIV